jgi:hypothetical protein
MAPEIFEGIMLVCFGCAWPLSIYKTWKAKSSEGKSLSFITVILLGYVSGILFEVFGDLNDVIYLYILNTLLVFTDLMLSVKYRHG